LLDKFLILPSKGEFVMKFRRNQIITIVIAFIFIFYGISHSVFKFNINKKIVDDISFVLVVIAAGLIISDHKKK